MSAYALRPAGPADDAGILALVGAPQPSTGLTLGFERAPSYFLSAHVSHEAPDVVVATVRNGHDDVVGVFNIGRRQVYLNGACRAVPYVGDMRLAPAHQGGRLLLYFNRVLRERLGEDGWYQTVILRENRRSQDTFAQGGRAGLPVYHPFGAVITSTVTACRRPAVPGVAVRAATAADIPAMNAFVARMATHYQFLPAYDFHGVLDGAPYFRGLDIGDFRLVFRDGELVALGGLWRQKEFKQTRVLAYQPALAVLRPFWNLWARWRGGLRLPAAGGLIDYVMMHSPLCAPDDLPAFSALLAALWGDLRAQGGHAFCLSLAENDPRREVLRLCGQHAITGQHYLATYQDAALPALDPSRISYFECGRL
ncbi:MAG TPA: hypothetical protein VFV15_08085 [Moraxellaceae bacterium]|nr:hypothetical protein [Moraxellaceae bacterium]